MRVTTTPPSARISIHQADQWLSATNHLHLLCHRPALSLLLKTFNLFWLQEKESNLFWPKIVFWMGRTSTLIYPPQTLFKLSLYPYYFLHWFLKSLTKAQKSTLSSKAYNTFLLPLLSIHSFSIHSVFKILILLSINGLTHAPYSLRKTYYSILKLRTDEVWTVEHRLFNKDIALFFLCSSSPILRPSKLQFQYRD